jgi:hypothetical protein
MLPSHSRTGSASTMSDFGAQHTAYDLAVYASPLRLPPRRKTRFRLAANLGRTGLVPARSARKVAETPLSPLTHVISSPFPRLRLAHTWHPFVSLYEKAQRALAVKQQFLEIAVRLRSSHFSSVTDKLARRCRRSRITVDFALFHRGVREGSDDGG